MIRVATDIWVKREAITQVFVDDKGNVRALVDNVRIIIDDDCITDTLTSLNINPAHVLALTSSRKHN